MVSVKGRTAKETKDILLHNLAVVIESRAHDIAEYVAQEIRDSGFGDKLAYGIVLTGGSAQLQHIDELFRRVTGMEVRIGTAEEAVDETSREKVASPAYSTAVGLLLRGAAHGDCAVTDIPRQAFRQRPTHRGPRPHRLPRRRLPRRTPQRKGRRKGPQPKPSRRRIVRNGACSTSSNRSWEPAWTTSSPDRKTKRSESPDRARRREAETIRTRKRKTGRQPERTPDEKEVKEL